MKARDVLAAGAGRSARHRNLILMGVGSLGLLVLAALLGVGLAAATPPTVTIDPVSSPGIVTAHAEGEVAVPADGDETHWGFEYAEEGQENWSGFPESGTLQPGESEHVESDLSGLKGEMHYEVRLVTHDALDGSEEVSPIETFTTATAVAPTLTLAAPSAVSATSSHLAGTIDPNGGNEDPSAGVLPIHWELQLSREGGSWEAVREEDLTGPNAQAATAKDIEADPTGLIPNSHYRVRLIARYAGLQIAEPEEATFPDPSAEFTTVAIAPEVGDATLREASPTSIILAGTVNPHNSPLSDCHFAWGAGSALDHTAPCESSPSGEGAKEVQAKLTGLTPGAAYSFQLSATNSVGTAQGAVRQFSTPTGALPPRACPNEAIRIAQGATQTGDCRAWERVSPADKGGGDIIAEEEAIIAAEDGDSAVFESNYSFADTVGAGAGGKTTYLAHRLPAGWATHSVTPQSRPEPLQGLFDGTANEAFSSDLSRSIVYGYDLPAATGDALERENMYLEDTATGTLRTISSSQRGDGQDPIQFSSRDVFSGTGVWGRSNDLTHVSFESFSQLLPTGTASGYPEGTAFEEFSPQLRYLYSAPNVYTWDDGTLHLAGVLPDGSVPPAGSHIEPKRVSGTMSPDGSRQTFMASPIEGAPSQLYLRIDHSRTALISESENPAFTEEAQAVVFEGMTPDGKNVFFVTDSPLLEEDEAPGADLYRWTDGPDPEHEANLTLITDDGSALNDSGAIGAALIGMSDDATRVYVSLVSSQLKLWEEGNGLKEIAEVPRPTGSVSQFYLLASEPGRGRVSRDGNWLAYIDRDEVLHLYDRQRDTLTTVAKNPSLFPTITRGNEKFYPGFRPRFLSERGPLFFTSRAALVPDDTNGIADVYSYDGPSGSFSLITSGKGNEPMEFADASADGSDVFFVTRARLVPSDHDNYADLYDARVGGGFAEPESPSATPCSGEGCQPVGNAAAEAPAVSTRGHTPGNVKQGHRGCGHGRRAVNRHRKVHCVKRGGRRHHVKSQRHSGANRGGAR